MNHLRLSADIVGFIIWTINSFANCVNDSNKCRNSTLFGNGVITFTYQKLWINWYWICSWNYHSMKHICDSWTLLFVINSVTNELNCEYIFPWMTNIWMEIPYENCIYSFIWFFLLDFCVHKNHANYFFLFLHLKLVKVSIKYQLSRLCDKYCTCNLSPIDKPFYFILFFLFSLLFFWFNWGQRTTNKKAWINEWICVFHF